MCRTNAVVVLDELIMLLIHVEGKQLLRNGRYARISRSSIVDERCRANGKQQQIALDEVRMRCTF